MEELPDAGVGVGERVGAIEEEVAIGIVAEIVTNTVGSLPGDVAATGTKTPLLASGAGIGEDVRTGGVLSGVISAAGTLEYTTKTVVEYATAGLGVNVRLLTGSSGTVMRAESTSNACLTRLPGAAILFR